MNKMEKNPYYTTELSELENDIVFKIITQLKKDDIKDYYYFSFFMDIAKELTDNQEYVFIAIIWLTSGRVNYLTYCFFQIEAGIEYELNINQHEGYQKTRRYQNIITGQMIDEKSYYESTFIKWVPTEKLKNSI